MSEDTMLFLQIWCGVYLLLSVIFGCISVFFNQYIKVRKAKCTEQTVGQVIRIERRRADRGTLFYPVVSYEANGNWVEQTTSVGSNPCRYVVGQSVPICYNPKMPGEIVIDGDRMLKLLARIFMIVALILFAVGLLGGVIALVVG